jgi:pimeloyl-ACP methyl ester carboxylesterase
MRLNYLRKGTGEALVFIHGLGSASTIWRSITEPLSNDFDTIAIDLPGHGKSRLEKEIDLAPHSLADYVVETLNHLQVNSFHLVGNSLGGWIALELAAKYPDRVRSLVGFAPAGLWLTPFTSKYPGTAVPRVLAKVTYPISPIFLRSRTIRKIAFANISPQSENLDFDTCFAAVRAIAQSPGYYPSWDGMLHRRFDKEIPASIPVTIVFGDTDKTLPARTSQERTLAPAHSKWQIWEKCGHAPMWDDHEKSLAVIYETSGHK